jgi:hypothetical protein
VFTQGVLQQHFDCGLRRDVCLLLPSGAQSNREWRSRVIKTMATNSPVIRTAVQFQMTERPGLMGPKLQIIKLGSHLLSFSYFPGSSENNVTVHNCFLQSQYADSGQS